MKSILSRAMLLFLMGLNLSSCVKPVMSCAGIKTNPRCTKLCTREAVVTCEGNIQREIQNINRMNQSNNNSSKNY